MNAAAEVSNIAEARNVVAKGEKKPGPLQDPFLNALRKQHVPVSIYLVNGIKLQGKIESFDQFIILLASLDAKGVTQMAYKHAISTVVPGRNFEY